MKPFLTTSKIVKQCENEEEKLEEIIPLNQTFYVLDLNTLEVERHFYHGRMNGFFVLAKFPVTNANNSLNADGVIFIKNLNATLRHSLKGFGATFRKFSIYFSEKFALKAASTMLKIRASEKEKTIESIEKMSRSLEFSKICSVFGMFPIGVVDMDTKNSNIEKYHLALGNPDSKQLIKIEIRPDSDIAYVATLNDEPLLETNNADELAVCLVSKVHNYKPE